MQRQTPQEVCIDTNIAIVSGEKARQQIANTLQEIDQTLKRLHNDMKPTGNEILLDNTLTKGTIKPMDRKFYVLKRPEDDGVKGFKLSISTTQGAVRVYVSQTHKYPDQNNHGWQVETSKTRDGNIHSSNSKFSPGKQLYISVMGLQGRKISSYKLLCKWTTNSNNPESTSEVVNETGGSFKTTLTRLAMKIQLHRDKLAQVETSVPDPSKKLSKYGRFGNRTSVKRQLLNELTKAKQRNGNQREQTFFDAPTFVSCGKIPEKILAPHRPPCSQHHSREERGVPPPPRHYLLTSKNARGRPKVGHRILDRALGGIRKRHDEQANVLAQSFIRSKPIHELAGLTLEMPLHGKVCPDRHVDTGADACTSYDMDMVGLSPREIRRGREIVSVNRLSPRGHR
mmetsp:Transcript_39656/g.64325  ORF Transcript_39656/g.64325 Transcript_39656/m.64325 type:complete len:398 (-) Transcript_39656:1045-2238(-)